MDGQGGGKWNGSRSTRGDVVPERLIYGETTAKVYDTSYARVLRYDTRGKGLSKETIEEMFEVVEEIMRRRDPKNKQMEEQKIGLREAIREELKAAMGETHASPENRPISRKSHESGSSNVSKRSMSRMKQQIELLHDTSKPEVLSRIGEHAGGQNDLDEICRYFLENRIPVPDTVMLNKCLQKEPAQAPEERNAWKEMECADEDNS